MASQSRAAIFWILILLLPVLSGCSGGGRSTPVENIPQTFGTVNGIITDEIGSALPGVSVSVSTSSIARSDELGQYTLDMVPVGEVTVQYAKDGFISTSRTVFVQSASETHVDLLLARPGLHAETRDANSSVSTTASHPGQSNRCGTCHSPHSEDGPDLNPDKLKLTDSTLCDNPSCHPNLNHQSHQNLAGSGQYPLVGCLNCHAPHYSNSYRLLTTSGATTKEQLDSLCPQCHATPPGKHVSSCAPCHNLNSALAYQLAQDPAILCSNASCHSVTSGAHSSECGSCHLAHTSEAKALKFPDGSNTACYSCHSGSSVNGIWPGQNYFENYKDYYLVSKGYNSPYVYQTLQSSSTMPTAHFQPPAGSSISTSYPNLSYVTGSCLNCHHPHGVDDGSGQIIPQRLRQNDPTLCYTCHTGKETEFTYSAVSVDGSDSQHSVGEQGSNITCSKCHNPHLVTAQAGRRVTVTWGGIPPVVGSEPDHASDLAAGYMHSFANDRFCIDCHKGTVPPAKRVFYSSNLNSYDVPIVGTTRYDSTATFDKPTGFFGPKIDGGDFVNYLFIKAIQAKSVNSGSILH